MRRFEAALLLLLTISTWATAGTPMKRPSSFALQGWEKQKWIDKAARTLRNGEGLSPRDDLAQLMSMSREDIVQTFMNDPRFLDTVLDFNHYFLGVKADSLRDAKGVYLPRVFSYPQAISSALAVKAGGDYLSLLDLKQPTFATPLAVPLAIEGIDPIKEPALARERWLAKAARQLDAFIANYEAHPETDAVTFCAAWRGVGVSPYGPWTGTGFNDDLFRFVAYESEVWIGQIGQFCLFPTVASSPPPGILERLKYLKANEQALFDQIRGIAPETYAPKRIEDIKTLDPKVIDPNGDYTQLNSTFWGTLTNSSTNFSRRRAAYVLKRFFCDDLTPINVEVPGTHAGTGHGSDPACMTCHYKLDPMAGFFRDSGIVGFRFAWQDKLIFDDNASTDRGAYQKAWLSEAGTGRTWNVGYVRSLSYPQHNEYGSSLEDLFATVRRSPEVRQCLVRRMSEYFIGRDQTMDAGYLAYLTQEFTTQAQINSSKAFKATVTRLILSDTFAADDPSTAQCYDYAPGESPAGRPPCQVAAVFETACRNCHGSQQGFGGLNLTSWIELRDGTHNFIHLDAQGKQHTEVETLTTIMDRLTDSDPHRRMPLNSFMPDGDRAKLVLWIDAVLNGRHL